MAYDGKRNGRYPSPSEKTLVGLIKAMTEGRAFYVVIDAMDECLFQVRKPLVEILSEIHSDVRILVTARLLERRDELTKGFAMENLSAHKSDMEEYIDYLINESSVLKQGDHEQIKRMVETRSNGM